VIVVRFMRNSHSRILPAGDVEGKVPPVADKASEGGMTTTTLGKTGLRPDIRHNLLVAQATARIARGGTRPGASWARTKRPGGTTSVGGGGGDTSILPGAVVTPHLASKSVTGRSTGFAVRRWAQRGCKIGCAVLFRLFKQTVAGYIIMIIGGILLYAVEAQVEKDAACASRAAENARRLAMRLLPMVDDVCSEENATLST
jgi:hypothetical protein